VFTGEVTALDHDRLHASQALAHFPVSLWVRSTRS
jgi:hypothetical protein